MCFFFCTSRMQYFSKSLEHRTFTRTYVPPAVSKLTYLQMIICMKTQVCHNKQKEKALVIYTFFSVGKMPPSYLFLSPAEHSFRWLCSLRTPLHGLLILLGALRSLTEDRSVDLSVSDSMLLLSTVKRKDRVQTRISFTFFPPLTVRF
jgi:hypothetical protein